MNLEAMAKFLLADCPECGKTFGVPDDPGVAADLAEVAAITGAIDFFREAEWVKKASGTQAIFLSAKALAAVKAALKR